MTLIKPIIVVGVGRSGSTALHEAFVKHPRLAWLSRLCSVYPSRPQINHVLMRSLDLPLLGRYVQHEVNPSESYRFWEYHAHGFSQPCRDLLASDLTVATKRNVRRALGAIPTPTRDRLLIKITGWPRLGFLREAMPDAKFIHIVRDGRAVVNSMLNVDWWDGWEGPSHWRYGELTPAQQAEWEHYDRSFVALAGIQWKILMDAMERAKRGVDADKFYEVTYEALCDEPVSIFREIVEFCELPWTPGFEQTIRRKQWRNNNTKWQRDLTPPQQAVLNTVLGEHLERYGYPVEPALVSK